MRVIILSIALLNAFTNLYASPNTGGDPEVNIELTDLSEDEFILNNIYYSMMMADGEDKLEVELVGESAASSVFVFGMNTQEMRTVTVKITDLSKTEVFAHREVTITPGANYRALNVTSLPVGNYIMTVEQDGKKVTKMIGIVDKD